MDLEQRKNNLKKMVDEAGHPEMVTHRLFKHAIREIICDAFKSFHDRTDIEAGESISQKDLMDWIYEFVEDRFTKDEDLTRL